MTTLREHYKSLSRDIIRHNNAYYVDHIEEIDDLTYDDMVLELIEIETKNPNWVTDESPSQDQQLAVNSYEPVSPHNQRIDYYPEVYTTTAISEWIDHTILDKASLMAQGLPFGCDYVLSYFRGDLISAITVGTGKMGNNHTKKLSLLACIPNSISIESHITITGTLTVAAANTTRRLSKLITPAERLEYMLHLEENLKFVVTDMGRTNANLPSMGAYMHLAERLGFDVVPYIRADTSILLEVINGIMLFLPDVKKYPYEVERIRVSHNSLLDRGVISRHVNQEMRDRYDPATTWRPYGLECLWGFEYAIKGTL